MWQNYYSQSQGLFKIRTNKLAWLKKIILFFILLSVPKYSRFKHYKHQFKRMNCCFHTSTLSFRTDLWLIFALSHFNCCFLNQINVLTQIVGWLHPDLKIWLIAFIITFIHSFLLIGCQKFLYNGPVILVYFCNYKLKSTVPLIYIALESFFHLTHLVFIVPC